MNYLFTSESVSEGHPDKVCDRISDEIVDLVFREAKKTGMDPGNVRIACETLATTNRVVIAGEVRVPHTLLKKDKAGNVLRDASGAPVVNPAKFKSTARNAIKAIGYEQSGFHWKKCRIDVLLHGQSADIAQGVDEHGNKDVGAGDQGIMFGYASRETPELLPAPIYYAHKILEMLTHAPQERRRRGEESSAPTPRARSPVKYENGHPVGVTQIVVSTQHVDDTLSSDDVRRIVEPYVREALPQGWITDATVWHVNPTGKFVVGGPDGDAGVTGRKIIVDTYGGAAPHGGGAFSRQGPHQGRSLRRLRRPLPGQKRRRRWPRRSRHDPAQLRHRRRPSRCRSMSICTAPAKSRKKSSNASSAKSSISRRAASREHLDLNKPIYAKTSAYGHFGRKPGRDGSFSWEKIDLVSSLKAAVKAA